MRYTLPDGKQILLEEIVRVSKIRDESDSGYCVDLSKLAFNIYFNSAQTLEIVEPYHYSDWSEKKLKLNQLREDLVRMWKTVVKDADDS